MAETDFKYDVFISYSGTDEDWVVDILLPALENAGLNVCIHFRDFEPGRPAIINMQDAAENSRHTILVMTPDWVAREWTLYEGILTRTNDPAGLQRRTIPLLLKKCDVPKFISMLTWVDFTRKDREMMAWKRLFAVVGKLDAPIPSTATASTSATGSRDTWYLAHPYPMPPNFTGRAIELKMLDNWLADNKDRLFILRALGGFGKSALAWQWINTHVNPAEWTKLVWWSFYEGDASFEHFVEETLKYLKLQIPLGQRMQVNELLGAMQRQKILLILDGFERALRAYGNMGAAYQGDELQKDKDDSQDTSRDCNDIFADAFLRSIGAYGYFMRSKVLMTTRLTPRSVERHGQFLQGIREEELNTMHRNDAVEFFHAQGIRGTHAEIEAACAPYGFHPLSLRILSGWIINDRNTPGDIAAAKDLEITNDIIQNKHHILEVGFDNLSPSQKKLLGRIACFRTPMTYEALKTLHDDENDLVFHGSLKVLESRGFLQWDRKANKYDLHPIVRRFAYDRLTAADRTGAHERLINYFAAVPKPKVVAKLEDLAPVIELYHHMVKAGKLDQAVVLFRSRLSEATYYQFGAYQLRIELLRALFLDGENEPPRLKEASDQAWILNSLANSYSMSGQPRRAVLLFGMANNIYQNTMENRSLTIGLGNLAYMTQLHIGALRDAENNLRRSIKLSSDMSDKHYEAISHVKLSWILAYCGDWDKAEKELTSSLALFKIEGSSLGIHLCWTYRSLSALLRHRAGSGLLNKRKYSDAAIIHASIALIWLDAWEKSNFAFPNHHIHAQWLLGAAYRANGDVLKAEESLSKVINLCRQINLVEREANILLDLARLRYDQKNYEEAKSLADEALTITERCGYALQGADVNLFLAQYALEQEQDTGKAKEYAETALKLAYCDGPPYYYKVAYEEAERMLKALGQWI